ncbi:DapH/DapD/GlmU-related protein [Lactococcus lactis]|uniref:DapH/DapD/GlmU-related protein n=1 Tax=Lactococcus lactis TaxID=1358 RepID=UPI003BF84A91
MFGPNVVLITGSHPISPKLRKKGMQYNRPIHIEKNVWLGAGVIVLPGITIGENSVIGAGSVVTKDIPANVVAVGNPCKILHKIE